MAVKPDFVVELEIHIKNVTCSFRICDLESPFLLKHVSSCTIV